MEPALATLINFTLISRDFNSMLTMVTEKSLTPVIDSVFPFESLDKAMERLRSGEQRGKIVITMDHLHKESKL